MRGAATLLSHNALFYFEDMKIIIKCLFSGIFNSLSNLQITGTYEKEEHSFMKCVQNFQSISGITAEFSKTSF